MEKKDENGKLLVKNGSNTHGVPMPWRGQMVTMRQGPTDPTVLRRAIEQMIEADINWLVIEVERGLRYDSHPKVSADWALSKETLVELLDAARRGGIQCVPLLPSLSHTGYIAEAYPKTAEASCVCPRRELTQKILDDLSDELLELFEPTFFHIGHDEMVSAFPEHDRISSLQCPLCRGDNAAEWFRDSIMCRYDYLKSRGIVTMMWADMLLDPEFFLRSSLWHGATQDFNGGPPDHFERALDDLPRDIVMCDWHYKSSCKYPSLRYLQDKGFDVLGCPKTSIQDNAYLFTRYAHRTRTPNLLGMLGTNWSEINRETEEILLEDIKENGFVFGGGDRPDLRGKALSAETRRFAEGPFDYTFDFAGDGRQILEAAWYKSFAVNRFSVPGIGLTAGRKGKLCLPFFGMPDCNFERLEIEIRTDNKWPGAGRTGISVDGGRSFTYKPLQKNTDWSDVVAGYSRILWLFEVCNEKEQPAGQHRRTAYAKCLESVTMRGNLGRRVKSNE